MGPSSPSSPSRLGGPASSLLPRALGAPSGPSRLTSLRSPRVVLILDIASKIAVLIFPLIS